MSEEQTNFDEITSSPAEMDKFGERFIECSEAIAELKKDLVTGISALESAGIDMPEDITKRQGNFDKEVAGMLDSCMGR